MHDLIFYTPYDWRKRANSNYYLPLNDDERLLLKICEYVDIAIKDIHSELDACKAKAVTHSSIKHFLITYLNLFDDIYKITQKEGLIADNYVGLYNDLILLIHEGKLRLKLLKERYETVGFTKHEFWYFNILLWEHYSSSFYSLLNQIMERITRQKVNRFYECILSEYHGKVVSYKTLIKCEYWAYGLGIEYKRRAIQRYITIDKVLEGRALFSEGLLIKLPNQKDDDIFFILAPEKKIEQQHITDLLQYFTAIWEIKTPENIEEFIERPPELSLPDNFIEQLKRIQSHTLTEEEKEKELQEAIDYYAKKLIYEPLNFLKFLWRRYKLQEGKK